MTPSRQVQVRQVSPIFTEWNLEIGKLAGVEDSSQSEGPDDWIFWCWETEEQLRTLGDTGSDSGFSGFRHHLLTEMLMQILEQKDRASVPEALWEGGPVLVEVSVI